MVKKKEKEKKRKIKLILGAIIVGVTMVLSGMYIMDPPIKPPKPQNPIDIISELNLKAPEVTFYVENFLDEIIFITNRPFDWEALNFIKNTSIEGVQKIEIEFVRDKYFIFRFKINTTDRNVALDNIYNTFRFFLNIEYKDMLLGVYDGYGYGIAKRFKILAPVFTQPDDFTVGAWYVRTANKTTEDIGLIFRIIEKCNNMSAIVKNITTVNIKGTTYDVKILEKLNISAIDINIENPKVEFINNSVDILIKNLMKKYNHTLSTDNITNISTINFANFVIKVKNLNASNATEIISFEFNLTKEEMENVLNKSIATKTKYMIIPGNITFKVDANVWNEEIYENIKKNLKNLSIEKQGNVNIADSCVHNKKLVVIPNNFNFDAILNLKRNVNDTINVNLNLYSIISDGEERFVPYLAVDNEME